jgi:hypothetical protein
MGLQHVGYCCNPILDIYTYIQHVVTPSYSYIQSNKSRYISIYIYIYIYIYTDRLCGLVVRVLGYRSGGPGSIPGTTTKKSSGSGTGSTQPREYN